MIFHELEYSEGSSGERMPGSRAPLSSEDKNEWIEKYKYLGFRANIPHQHSLLTLDEIAAFALSKRQVREIQSLLGLVMGGSIWDGGAVSYRESDAWQYIAKHPKLLCKAVETQIVLAYLCAREDLQYSHDVSCVLFELLNVVVAASEHGAETMQELMEWKDNKSMTIKIKRKFCDQDFAKESRLLASYFASGAGGVRERHSKLIAAIVFLVLLNLALYFSGVSRFS